MLELGTGASTIVIAHALKEIGGGTVTSMEESEEWYRHAVQNLPQGLPVHIVLSKTVEDTFSIFRGIRYRDVPNRPYDFIFVDGPAYKTSTRDVTFDFDLISVVANPPLRCAAIIDKRVSTCFVSQARAPRKGALRGASRSRVC